eukprot:Colp12_sorted_trinity150504_noHs@8663
MADEGTSTQTGPSADKKTPPVLLVMGMAGSGKTTLMQRLNSHAHAMKKTPYILNLDPAVRNIPFGSNVDIQDTVNYKEVMKQYNLGPNGAILTSLNLFATRFDQVLDLLEKRAAETDYVMVDTPGQIEIFTWSASGAIITEALAASFPTIIVYVVDTPRCSNPVSFMSNMLYACSILYKTKLPMIVVFNKTDIVSHEFAVEWMQDFEALQAALNQDPTYMSSLTRSMSLVLDEFYETLKVVGVSAVTGEGVEDFFDSVESATQEYYNEYLPEMQRLKKKKEEEELRARQAQLDKLKSDLENPGKVVADAKKEMYGAEEEGEEDEDEYGATDDDEEDEDE